MFRSVRSHRLRGYFLPVFVIASIIAAAACGGGEEGMHPVAPNASASAIPPGDASVAMGAPSEAGMASVVIEMKPPIATAMKSDLEALGLDLSHLPPLGKLEPRTLRKVMPLFAKALGVKCTGCHADDIAAPTPNKKVATKMWNEFVVKLSASDGTPIFCDSCHQGRELALDRRDEHVLGEWMNLHFVKELSRRDSQDNSCATCHGEPRQMRFLDKWRQ